MSSDFEPLLNLKRNIVDWYPFEKNSKIMEIWEGEEQEGLENQMQFDYVVIIGLGNKKIKDLIEIASLRLKPTGRLLIAVDNNNYDMEKLLISKGADVNIKSVDKMTALSYAVRYGKIQTAKKLIAKGADVNNVYYYGKTPLIEAAEKGNYEMVKLLVSNGADFDHKNNGYDTALDIAKRDRNMAINKEKPTKDLDKIIKFLEKQK